MSLYTIKQGNHYCDGLNFKLHNNKTQLNFSAMFHENCLYKIDGVDNQDINKLYGLTWGLFNDKNSFRIGWNCERENGLIQLFSYTHQNGVVIPEYLGEVAPLETTYFNIFLYRAISSIEIRTSSFTKNIFFNFGGVSKTGYYNWPYFGGNQPAPHDMNISIW